MIPFFYKDAPKYWHAPPSKQGTSNSYAPAESSVYRSSGDRRHTRHAQGAAHDFKETLECITSLQDELSCVDVLCPVRGPFSSFGAALDPA